jgi:hypothetical protein
MKNNYKLWIILSLIVVFIAGVISGILIDKNVLNERKPDTRRQSSTHFPTLEIMAEELALSAEQQEQIMHRSLSDIRAQLLTDIKSVLTENQKNKFEAMIDKYRSQRKREYEKRKNRQEKSDGNKGDHR